MAVTITCHLATLGRIPAGLVPDENFPVPCHDGVDRTLAQIFSRSSGRDIDLVVNGSLLGTPASPGLTEVTAAELHQYCSQVTGNSREANYAPLKNICVIYSNKLRGHPGVRGLMFDMGFRSEFEGIEAEEWAKCPREGCAVFLEAIRDSRKAADLPLQTAYTSTHELGHVFNLLHTSEATFMRQSPSLQLPAADCFQFSASEQLHLGKCSTQRGVYPGGYSFGDTSYLGGGDSPALAERGSPPLELKLMASCEEFLPFEPVELDMTLSVKQGRKVPRGLRNEMDPAYSGFTVWIEEPTGERRKYKSINHCCDNSAPCPVLPGKPFQRDLTIFGQSGGYTFRHAGGYQVWVTWQLNARTVVQSNVVTFSVRPLLGLSEKDQALCERLRAAGRPLYYRARTRRKREMDALKSLCKDTSIKSARFSVTMSRYAKYRMDMQAASRSPSFRKQHARALSEQRRWLKDQQALGEYRRQKV